MQAPLSSSMAYGSRSTNNNNDDPSATSSAAAAATASLQRLLREDAGLTTYGLTSTSATTNVTTTTTTAEEEGTDPTSSSTATTTVAHAYAAALLAQYGGGSTTANDGSSTPSSSSSHTRQAAARQALQDVERKLALVESLAVKLSRTSPAAVAGPFLRWHGYAPHGETVATESANDDNDDTETSTHNTTTATTTTTLAAVRDRADRLERQAHVLERVAIRVEGSLDRAVNRLDDATRRLTRVLALSQTLKRVWRLHFEWTKVQTYDFYGDDMRDLTRAAASVAVLEDLLDELPASSSSHEPPLAALANVPPQARQLATQVRQAARTWWQKCWQQNDDEDKTTLVLPHHWAATLQVYHSLHELPMAVWQAVDHAHARIEAATEALAQSSPNSSSGSGTTTAAAATAWAATVTHAAVQVQQMQRILAIKTDPERRVRLLQVVAQAPVPAAYRPGYASKDKNDGRSGSSSHGPTSRSPDKSRGGFDLWALFWYRVCDTVGHAWGSNDEGRTLTAQQHADLYPAVRAAAQDVVARLREVGPLAASATTTIPTGRSLSFPTTVEGPSSSSTTTSMGLLGGRLPPAFWETAESEENDYQDDMDNPQTPPDVWTSGGEALWTTTATTSAATSTQSSSTTARHYHAGVLASPEWEQLQGNAKTQSGLYRLQEAFVQACTQRLCDPLQYLFPEHVTLDDHGVPLSGGALSLLPSKYDIQRFDENIRRELSLANPRQGGGGDLTLVPMIAACVVHMMTQFCERAQQALSGARAHQYLASSSGDWTMSESLQHDRKVAVILFTIANYLRAAPEKTFVAPYRPAHLPAHQEAATLCTGALQPALTTLDDTVHTHVLAKLVQSLNQRMATLLAKVHAGVYLGDRASTTTEEDAPAFCQTYIAPALTAMTSGILSRFPPPYATYLASCVSSFCIYMFCSNVALLRPLGESARLHITQDLADLEMALEQFIAQTCGSAVTLAQLDKGKPYAELRGVRQMLYWNGLSSASRSTTAGDLARSLWRETWIRHVRPSTVLHALFAYAPPLLTSPHHAQRVSPDTYAQRLVSWDGRSDGDAEETAWMNTLACCDAYQQRQAASSSSGTMGDDGDPRIAALLLALGPELLRRRRQ